MPRVPNPPFIETGIPSVSPGVGNGGTAYIADLCTIPPEFRGKFANGLAVVATLPGDRSSGGSLAMFLNNGRTPESLTQGWAHAKDAYIDAGYNNFSATNISVAMASQHYGEYLYAAVYRSAGDGWDNIEQIWRMRSPNVLEIRHHQKWDPSFGAAPYPSGLLGARGHLHVSSGYHPRIWFVQGNRVMCWVDRGAGWWFGWQNSYGDDYTTKYWRFEAGHYVQWYDKPPGRDDIRGPILTFPWRSGTKGAPELWWIAPEINKLGQRTGRNVIYASRWKPWVWRIPGDWFVLTADNHGPDSGLNKLFRGLPGTEYSYNKKRFAFEHEWYNDAHIVGVMPPLRGLGRDEPLPTHFQFRRDRTVRNRLWAMASRSKNIYADPGAWDGLWWGFSDDDGKTWRTMRPMMPAAGEPYSGVTGPATQSGSFAMLPNGTMLTSVRGSMERNRQLLITPNWTPQGVGTPDRQPTIYRRGETKGAVWI